MSFQTPYSPPNSPPRDHGGDFDPNGNHFRQAHIEYAASNSTGSVNSQNITSTVDRPHGGDTDPNELRHRHAGRDQSPISPSPLGIDSGLARASSSHEGTHTPRPQIRPVQHGYGFPLASMQSSPPSGDQGYQSPQAPTSPQSGQHLPSQHGYQPPHSGQASQSPQSYHPGFALPVRQTRSRPDQANVQMRSILPQVPRLTKAHRVLLQGNIFPSKTAISLLTVVKISNHLRVFLLAHHFRYGVASTA